MMTNPSPRRRSPGRQAPFPDSVLFILLIAFLLALTVTGVLTFLTVRDAVAGWGVGQEPGVVAGEPTPALSVEEQLGSRGDDPLQPAGGPPPAAWDGKRRITVLVMGLDYRDWESGDAPRTDTMILLSVDPEYQTAGMLSIPRDLWVDIPGYGPNKINTAYRLGEVYNLPGGGPGLAIQTVEQTLGMEIDYYAQIDFNAFVDFIDEIGGVKINVPEEIQIDPLGDNNTKTLQPGVQTLPGDLALAYARARNTIGSDFDRAQRQQQVIMGIRDRILDADMLPTLIQRSPAIYEKISSGVRSNMSIFQAIELAWIAQQVPDENIRRGVIDLNYVNNATSPEGLSILVPMMDEILRLRDEIFNPIGPIAPAAPQVDPQSMLEAEGAQVEVLNGTTMPGLASETVSFLGENGLSAQAGNAGEPYSSTTLIDYTGNPYTVEYLISLMSLSPDRVYHRYDPSSPVDIVLVLGDDWAAANPMPVTFGQ